MELLDLLVRRHEDDHAQALPDQAVDDVQEPREPLAGALAGVRAQQLAGVLHHEQAPEPVVLPSLALEVLDHLLVRGDPDRRAVPLAADHHRERRLEQDGHQVIRVLAEERVRVDDVVDLAPLAPLPGERPQGKRLAGARVAVPKDELPAPRGLEVAHERRELVPCRRRVVRLDLVPGGHGDRPPRRARALRRVHPERDRDLVGRAGIRRRKELL